MFDRNLVRKWTIYKIENPDNRVYIGKTYKIRERICSHKSIKRQANFMLAKSIEKHGWEAHTVTHIEHFESDDDFAQKREIFWIEKEKCNINRYPLQNGLNQTDGGGGIKGYKQNDETKRKIGAANAITAKGRKQSQSTIDKRLKPFRKPVAQYDLEGNYIKTFPSGLAACRDLYPNKKKGSGHISNVARGKMKSYRGFIYKFVQ